MPVEVRLPTVLRPHAGGQSSVQASGATIGEVLEDLTGTFPGMAGQVLTEQGALHRFVNVYVNDDDVRYLDQLETKVGDHDVVSILPAVAGGSGPGGAHGPGRADGAHGSGGAHGPGRAHGAHGPGGAHGAGRAAGSGLAAPAEPPAG